MADVERSLGIDEEIIVNSPANKFVNESELPSNKPLLAELSFAIIQNSSARADGGKRKIGHF